MLCKLSLDDNENTAKHNENTAPACESAAKREENRAPAPLTKTGPWCFPLVVVEPNQAIGHMELIV